MPFTDAGPVGNQLYGFPINCLYNHLRVISSVLSMVSTTTLGTLLTIAEMCIKLTCSSTCSIDHAYKVGADPHQDRRAYNRKDYTRYPYKSHWQTFRAWYGLVSCSLLVLFNGWRSVMPPASANNFIPSYISVS